MLIKSKLTIIFLSIAIVPVILIATLSFYKAKNALYDEELTKLEAITALKADKVESFLKQLKADIQIAQDYYNIKTNLPIFSKYAENRSASQYLAAKKMLDGQLASWKNNREEIIDIMLVDTSGKIVYVVNETHMNEDLDSFLSDSYAFGKGKREVYFGEVFRRGSDSDSDEFEFLITAPLTDFNNNFIGVIVFEIDLFPVYDLIQNSIGLGETGETILGQKKGNEIVFLNNLQGKPNAAYNYRISIGSKQSVSMQNAIKGETGSGLSLDYRGEKVIAAWQYIPVLKWGLVAKVDLKEAFHSITVLKKQIHIIMMIIMMCVGAIALFIANSISEPIIRLTDSVDTISKGSLENKVFESKRKDEIGTLSSAFNRMIDSLLLSRKSEEVNQKELIIALSESKRRNKQLDDSKNAMLSMMKELEKQTKNSEENQKYLEQSNAELEQFAYIASHDLQEPLRMISSYVHLLDKRYSGQLDAKADKYIFYAVDGAKRMQGMINDILLFSRVGREEAKFENVDINDIINIVCINLKNKIEESSATIIANNLPVIRGEKGQLTQLFQNLIQNAIKFKGDDPSRVEITASKENYEWLFSVSDNGIGIDPQFSDKVFTLFKRLHSRRDFEGNGLGLAISKKVVELHKGKIWVEPNPDNGTIFHFTIST